MALEIDGFYSCGSEKMYEICCEEGLFLDNYKRYDKFLKQSPINHSKLKRSYVSIKSHRAVILQELDILKKCLDLNPVSTKSVQYYAAHILKISYLSLEYFNQNIKPMYSRETINSSEREILIEISEYILDQHLILDKGCFPNYNRIKSLVIFVKDFLERNIHVEKNFEINVYLDTNDIFIKWELIEQLSETVTNKKIKMVFIDDISQMYADKHSQYPGLLDSSIHALIMIDNQEDNLPIKSAELLSYLGLVMNYFGVMESELKNLIGEILNYMDFKFLMWRDIKEILSNNIIFYSGNFQNELIDGLSSFNKIRNAAAHGQFVSLKEYNEVKNFISDINFFSTISERRLKFNALNEFNDFNEKLKTSDDIWKILSYSEDFMLKVPIDTLCLQLDLDDLDINFSVACIYKCVDINLKKCEALLIKGANKGHIKSEAMLGFFYEDQEKSMYWLEKASLHGNASAMYTLSVELHYEGEGYEWLDKAAKLGCKDAQSDLEIIKKRRGLK